MRKAREKERGRKWRGNKHMSHPPSLTGEETSVNEIDSFPAHGHNHPPPSVFDKHALIHTQAHAHTHTNTCAPATATRDERNQ